MVGVEFGDLIAKTSALRSGPPSFCKFRPAELGSPLELAFSSLMPKLPPAVASLVRAGPSTARLSNRGLISIVGPQATDWLNGILASTVPNPPTGHFFTAILQAHASTSLSRPLLSSPSNLKVFHCVHQG